MPDQCHDVSCIPSVVKMDLPEKAPPSRAPSMPNFTTMTPGRIPGWSDGRRIVAAPPHKSPSPPAVR
jgi:hypothetical protein